MPRRRRARILAEVEDHLLCAAAELRATGLSLAEAEACAVGGFGEPGELGRALSAVDARRHTVRAGWLTAPLAIAAGWLGLRGVVGLGAPLPIALTGFVLAQVALVAGGLTAFRAWLVRRGGDPALLGLVRRGSGLVAGCMLVVGAGAAVTAAAPRDAADGAGGGPGGRERCAARRLRSRAAPWGRLTRSGGAPCRPRRAHRGGAAARCRDGRPARSLAQSPPPAVAVRIGRGPGRRVRAGGCARGGRGWPARTSPSSHARRWPARSSPGRRRSPRSPGSWCSAALAGIRPARALPCRSTRRPR